ncbi:MAG: DUF1552 domain-containing protein [Planctomycetales bacterium]|nr:DUF1552 domain-containing protein [Planctomycetales bacterium]
MNRLTNASRRQFLYGAGVAMMLPRLESLAADSAQPAPKRFLGLYVGHGFAITPHGKDDHPSRDWSWYPRVVDGRMKFGKSTAALQPLEQQLSVFYGLDHPGVVVSNGHSSADSFLNGSNPRASVISPSVDQVAAMHHGKETRFPSLVLGNEGGLGIRGGSHTLSYNRTGRAIPSENNLPRLYNRLFNSDPAVVAEEKTLYQRNGDLVDRVLESARDLKRRVSLEDNRQIDSYLESVRAVERNIARMRQWADTPKPDVSGEDLALKATVAEPAVFIETMYSLVYLAFRTDSTRYATYMLQTMGSGVWDDMPKNALGLNANHHLLAHNAAGSGAKAMEQLGTYDKFQADLLAGLLRRMADTPEAGGTMLDHTLVLFGCSNSKTHVNRDYPLLLAGGQRLGVRQGSFHDFANADLPFSNLLLTILRQLDVPVERFSDSTGVMEEVLA